MEINIFLFIFTLILFYFQIFGRSSSNNMLMPTSPNVTSCIQRERESLLAFKHTLTDRHNLLSTWKGLECCEWHGVGCHIQTSHVIKLDLRNPDPFHLTKLGGDMLSDIYLEGELNPSLQNLKHLRYLDLSLNRFSGNIPKFLGSFQRLEYLNLSGSFRGVVPHHLGNLSRLQSLDLRNAFFTYYGRLQPKVLVLDDLGWVSSLSSLRYLDLSGTTIGEHIDWFHPLNMLPSLLTLKLAGCSITNITSVKFVNFTSLNSLDLSDNYINSTVPVWLSNLTVLTHLQLSENSFHGSIPHFLGMFSDLVSIDLSYNNFETLMPDLLCNLSSLVVMGLSDNGFSGHIPACLGQLLRLEYLSLGYNQLSGNIPISLRQLSKLKGLALSSNLLVGVVSEAHFTKLENLNYLILSGNSLAFNFSSQWTAPFQLNVFTARYCNIGPRFPNWLQTQTHLVELILSNSGIKDTIPKWFENILSHILYLDLSYNQIGGNLPRIHFNSSWMDSGVFKMNSNKFEGSLATFPSNVELLDLSDNLLSGHVPPTDETMNPNLRVVILSKNRFSGNIPVHLCKLHGIEVLDLSDNLFSGHVPPTDETMNPNLRVVILSKNRFSGNIPVHLCKFPAIEILDLSQNNYSGRLPRCLGNLINLQVMDISNNTITGVVPSSLGSLTELESLHLRNNIFEGKLPLSLKNLTWLVILDIGNNFLIGRIPSWIGESLLRLRILSLQSNKFTGKIPLQLCQLNVLQHLNLAHNNIIGTIPRCFSNLSGMIINQDDSGYLYHESYEENILATTKGNQLLYTRIIEYLITLDLSSNNITSEIPDVLMNLIRLKNLNLSRNQIKGQIPRMIGNLSQIESLDLSMNRLSGRIPQSLTSLNFLSYLNLSFNNLTGAIPVGNQLQTLVDPYIYEGNDELCWLPVSRSCNGNNSSSNRFVEGEGLDDDDDDDDDDDESLWFYSGVRSGFVVGFIGLLGSLYFITTWRLSYFIAIENVYGWLHILVLLNLARLRSKFFPMIS